MNSPDLSNSPANRKILVGVSAGIAAYKCCEIVRRLKTLGADVRVVMTPGAEAFVSAMTFQALSGNPVRSKLLDPDAEAGMGHIELARWADRVLVAPATANFMAQLAHGRADDLLSTLCLATPAPVSIAPAMNQQMWANAATQANVTLLQQQGIQLIGPASGEQACGDLGMGRMMEPADIVDHFNAPLIEGLLHGKHVLITGGPTREAIDPVRYISNHSSGKMAYALAAACQRAGAHTCLVSGPVNLLPPRQVERVSVTSAADMHDAVMQRITECDLFIGAAAVADYRPATVSEQKIKKQNDRMQIELVRNPDIIADVAQRSPRPAVVGFAAESQNLEHYARDKLIRKDLDMIVANDISRSDVGFSSDENEVLLIGRQNSVPLKKMPKTQLAETLVTHFSQLLQQPN